MKVIFSDTQDYVNLFQVAETRLLTTRTNFLIGENLFGESKIYVKSALS